MLGSNRLRLLIKASIAASIVAAPGVYTSAYAADDEAGTLALEEILVSARKRDESLSDVPLTITVLSADAIEMKAIEEIGDIVDFTPGFHYGGPTIGSQARTNRRLIMRGMQVSTDAPTRQGATMFIDGAPVLGSEIGSLFDVARIEVVKGPQSAYFGRSTFAGAINVITSNPSEEFQGEVRAGAGEYGTYNFGASIEGGLIEDKLAMRLSASKNGTDGQYQNANNHSETLGRRETTDISTILYITPTDNFSAKIRLHAWEDDDGPSASFAYAANNAVDAFNCNRGGTAPNLNGGNNWICGTPRNPRSGEINPDTVVRDGSGTALALANKQPGQSYLLGSDLDGFGMFREAFEASVILDWALNNGLSLSSITAWHGNEHRQLDDFDRRYSAFGADSNDDGTFDEETILFTDEKRRDFFQEFRVTSADDQKLRWMAGISYSDAESEGTNMNHLFGSWRSPGNGITTSQTETIGYYGSLGYDLTDQITLSAEGRYQVDDVTDGTEFGATLDGEFTSFTPRLIVDYKPVEELTLYASYAEGTRPGEFNSGLVGLDPEIVSCIASQVGADIEIDEEDLKNFELGAKWQVMDGRGLITAAVYQAEWTNQHTRGAAVCPDANGDPENYFTTGTGGETDLQGIELEFVFAVTEALMLEGTFALNDTEILVRDCSDCDDAIGDRDITGLDKEFSRVPRETASLSANYRAPFRGELDWFLRGDYIWNSGTYATEANLTETGDMNKVNLRLGVESESLRFELYGTNIFDDDTLTGFQHLPDFATNGGNRQISAGLPDKQTFGVRAIYKFGS
jgi:iron complex outermembrane receptor protein